MEKVIVREGTRKDIPHVLGLIRELAAYERAPLEVEVTEQELENDAFGYSPVIKIIVAELNDAIVGMAIYYTKYSSWKGKCIFLEDIIVTESQRKKGIGDILFRAVVEAIKPLKPRRLEWQVLEWNTPAIEFYKKLQSTLDPEWINCKLVEKQIQDFQ